MKIENTYKVIIIGAGPAGLSLAYMLRKFNIDYLVLEKGQVGNSWFNMPDKLHILSPLWTNILPGSRFPLLTSYRKPLAQEYAHYLSDYKDKNKLKVYENSEVLTIEKHVSPSQQYTIQTKTNKLSTNIIVCATGYFNTPYTPDYTYGNDQSILQLHAKHYKSPQQIKEHIGKKGKVLIVGSRISAGQIMLELFDARFEVSISYREEIRFRKKSLLMTMKEIIYFPYEELMVKFSPNQRRDSSDIMDGGKTEDLISSKKVKTRPAIHSISNNKVHFIDGKQDDLDLIIYATGYRPTLNYISSLGVKKNNNHVPLTQAFESTQEENIFFLGFDNIRNFRSRYLRGIKHDSKLLAKRIYKRIIDQQTTS